eukprot:NODE_5082_length_701_cov_9.379791_g4919_i0.p1 GENE.NODE_5082_length_701_cov_9.379791_g4919_i0~~NODE_5082_length_701_cov_9.379791_g4919_i0.p1  ORF type:complete len:224 (+),score=47.54 NODE_5082_length_701_cov_9.379791_g4919_i0:49-672(+)
MVFSCSMLWSNTSPMLYSLSRRSLPFFRSQFKTRPLTTDKEITYQHCREVFAKCANALSTDNVIDFREFEKLCLEDLHLQLSPTELHRIFHRMDTDNNGVISFEEFLNAVQKSRFVRSIASHFVTTPFTVPPTYDYTQPTDLNYQAPTQHLTGAYAHIRAERDYRWPRRWPTPGRWWSRPRSSLGKQGTPVTLCACGVALPPKTVLF